MKVSIHDLCDSCRGHEDIEYLARQLSTANQGSFSRGSKGLYEIVAKHLRNAGCTTCPSKLESAVRGY